MGYLPELESVRGIAMLLVFVFHLDGLVRFPSMGRGGEHVSLLTAVVRSGENGVSLFFVLSAFLLAMPFLRAAAGGERVDVGRFAKRRMLRILPLYYATLICGLLVTVDTMGGFVSRLSFFVLPDGIPGLDPRLPPFSNVWWSLATEAQFYFLLPLLPLAIRTRRGRRGGMLALAAFAAVYTMYELRFFHPRGIPAEMKLASSLFGRAPLFLWGIAASALFLRSGTALRLRLAGVRWLKAGGGDLVLLAILAAILAVFQWRIDVGPKLVRLPPYHAYHVLEGALWASFLVAFLVLPLRWKALLHNRFLEHCGVLSYSIYLVHMPILWYGMIGLRNALRSQGMTGLVDWNATTLAMAAALAVLTYVVSRLTYRYIESPFLRRKDRI